MSRPVTQFLTLTSLCLAMTAFCLESSLASSPARWVGAFSDSSDLHQLLSQEGLERFAGSAQEWRPQIRNEQESKRPLIARRILAESANIFRETSRARDMQAKLRDMLDELAQMRSIHASLEPYLEIRESLLWLEEQQRFLEGEILSNPIEAKKILLESPQSLDVLWLRIRLDRLALKDPSPEITQTMQQIAPGPSLTMDSLLRMRIAAHSASDLFSRKSSIERYCSALSRHGLAQEIDIDSNREIDWHRALSAAPGCIRLRALDANSARIVQVISDQPLVMPFDSVVLAHGVNLSISTRSFDGSLFDLSAPELDAASLPGPAGSFTIDVRLAEDSYLPAFVSFGMDAATNPTEADNETRLSRTDGLFSFLVAGEIRRVGSDRETL